VFFRRAVAGLSLTLIATAGLTAVAGTPAGAVAPSPAWTASTGKVLYASPTIADINGDGIKDVVVGDQTGTVSVLSGSNGANVAGWPQQVHVRAGSGATTAVESSPTVADLDKDGHPEIIVGAGSLNVQSQPGGVEIFNSNGSLRWQFESQDLYNIWTGGGPDDLDDTHGASVAVGDVNGDGFPDVVAPGHIQYTDPRGGYASGVTGTAGGGPAYPARYSAAAKVA